MTSGHMGLMKQENRSTKLKTMRKTPGNVTQKGQIYLSLRYLILKKKYIPTPGKFSE